MTLKEQIERSQIRISRMAECKKKLILKIKNNPNHINVDLYRNRIAEYDVENEILIAELQLGSLKLKRGTVIEVPSGEIQMEGK